MRSKWKYDSQPAISKRQLARGNKQLFYCFLAFASIAVLFISCRNNEEQKHIPNSKAIELDGLVQPANQIVLSDVKTIVPIQLPVAPVINATGVISYDPGLLNNISARFSGRIEKLYVRFNFENVTKGQPIMDIYSPEILTEQENLIYLLTNAATDQALVIASKQKLQLLGLTDAQLRQIEKNKKAINPIPVYSLYSGHIHDIGVSNSGGSAPMNNGPGSGMNSTSNDVLPVQIENLPSSQSSALSIKEGMYVQSDQAIFAVYNTNRIWAVLNIFPGDAAMIKVGDKVAISAESNSGHLIDAAINYIEPVTGQNASAIKARVYLNNEADHHLKIGTLITAKIKSHEINGWWLPRNAIVNLGQQQIVFLKTENHFSAKSIVTGIKNDSLVQIISSLNGTEQVAANAQYLVDSESFIKTKSNKQ